MCASAAHTLPMGFEPPLPPDDHVRLLVPRADKRWQTGSRLSFGALSLVLCAPDCCVGVPTVSPPSCRGWGTSRRASRAASCCTLRAWAPTANAFQLCTSANTRAKSDSFLPRALAFCCSGVSQTIGVVIPTACCQFPIASCQCFPLVPDSSAGAFAELRAVTSPREGFLCHEARLMFAWSGCFS